MSHGEHNFGWQAWMCWTSLGFLAGELVKWNDLTFMEFFFEISDDLRWRDVFPHLSGDGC